jgi:hypothetical protein
MREFREKLTYANVVSTLCLFLLLGGGAAFAASKLPRNSVGPKQIRKNAVNSGKVRNHSLRAADFKQGQLPAGPKGDPGLRGVPGPKGDPGPALVRLAQNVEQNFAIETTRKTVAVIGEQSEATYSGSYSPGLEHPAGLASYLAINVQAHVASITGTSVTCYLEVRKNSGSWSEIASAAAPIGDPRDLFMNGAIPSFSAGDVWSFRIQCQTGTGTGTARGEIGVVAGSVGG